METIYELKNKRILMPIKLLLLVIAMAMFGLNTYAQEGKPVKVANDRQLTEAMGNPSINIIELAAGYYKLIDYYADEGAQVVKQANGNGNRADECLYFIVSSNICFTDPDAQGFVQNQAQAGTIEPIGCTDCCPENDTGLWSVRDQPPGSTINLLAPLNLQLMPFEVNMVGVYTLRYSWGAPFNSHVETQYYFYGPVTIELSAPDVCETDGLSTEVNFVLSSLYPDPNTIVSWYLNGAPYAGPSATGTFTLTVPECGYYTLGVEVVPTKCPPVYEYIYIDFSCEPVADAGPDVYICDDLCTTLNGNITIDGPVSPVVFEYSWVNISGPQGQTLVLDPISNYDVYVCRAPEPACSYGTYEVQLQVQNGECYDEDNAMVTFYEQPISDAGDDQRLCNTFTFNLAADPYDYCGVEGINYWPTRYWIVISKADPGATIQFTPSIYDPNAVVTITSTAPCPYGMYEFGWVEINSLGPNFGGCQDTDGVNIFIYEDPAPDAGDDIVFCNTFAFSLDGTGDMPCYQSTGVRYNWTVVSQPDDCDVFFFEGNELDPDVQIANCDPAECPYGKYTFQLEQSNGYFDVTGLFVEVCSSTDQVDVWIMEAVAADAGMDQHLCNTFSFDLAADPTELCGTAGINYFTWGEWEFVGGPAPATILDVNDPASGVTINTAGIECPYGAYTFRWYEYNGFGTPFQGCLDYDEVTIYIYEDPAPDAGDDMEFCETDLYPTGAQGGNMSFQLDGALDLPCGSTYSLMYEWVLFSAPGDCIVTIGIGLNPVVEINPDCLCAYGDYVFAFTQKNGYVVDQEFITVCETTDYVTVTIYQQPEIQSIGEDLYLCDMFEFDLSAEGSLYDCNPSNWYEWELVSQPAGAGCTVTITGGDTETPSVSIDDCTGDCPYGEYVFRFTEYNGSALVYCEDWAEVSVFIFEAPVADAGEDQSSCVLIGNFPGWINMEASLEYCYSMYGEWSKSCGPGDLVLFDNLNDPQSKATFYAPGKYEFVWTVWNVAEGCEDTDTVTFIWLEQPSAWGTDDELIAECDALCIGLGAAGIVKYDYYGTDEGECPNYTDLSHWTVVGGPGTVTFADDENPATSMCVDMFGCYTVRWNEINKIDDQECTAHYDVYVAFIETPDPFAGDDDSVCDHCYTMQATSYFADPCLPGQSTAYWAFVGYEPPADPCPTDNFHPDYTFAYTISNTHDPNARICIFDDCLGTHYGTYTFKWVNSNEYCTAEDLVSIEFKKVPEELGITGIFDPSNCGNECPNCEVDCLMPGGDVMTVCPYTSLNFCIDWDCFCYGAPIPGYTYEWSFTGPAGSYFEAEPYWYDCDDECWRGDDCVFIYFGECCDTARLYLTITSPEGCETTEEWKFFVQHNPCAEITGPEVAEVSLVDTWEYCNCFLPEPDPCLLYTWSVEHCGEIVSGQGTQCIEVMWTDYNENGGWGEIMVTVADTCTGCCATSYMYVKVHPNGTVGDATLSGQVMYHNNIMTPLNGVLITLWNGDVPVFETESFVKFVDDNPPYTIPGYYEFPNVNGMTEFGLSAAYDAPWYGANATDALAVELKVVGLLPPPPAFVWDTVVYEAMDVNNSLTLSATDALWIKQRAVGMVNYFPAGDWVFAPDMAAAASDSPYDIWTLNAGDANRSNIPNSTKAAPAIDLITDGVMNVTVGQEFILPIRIADAHVFGAITLNLGYDPAVIKIVEVVPVEGMVSNITGSNVRIAWSGLNPLNLSANDVVISLKVKTLGEVTNNDLLFSIGVESEFADAASSVVEPVTLKTLGVTTGPAAADYFLSSNRPNPFSTYTTIEYTLPETGKVKLSVLDMLGQELEVLVESTQSAGSYSVEFSAAGLATGVYIYKITVDGENRDFISTQRMIVSH